MGCSPTKMLMRLAEQEGGSRHDCCLMSTYRLAPEHTFYSGLLVFGEDVEIMELFPPPLPTSYTKKEIFSQRKYSDLDKRACQTPSDLLMVHYSRLAWYLFNGVEDDVVGKLRAIYRWVTSISIFDMEFPDIVPDWHTPLYQLWKIKNNEGNYAQLVAIMCRLVDVPCVIIHGRVKGGSYELGQWVSVDKFYDEWNAVLIHGDWYFIDAHWGSCATVGASEAGWTQIENGGETDKPAGVSSRRPSAMKKLVTEKSEGLVTHQYDEDYFLADASQMIATHHPSLPHWQLMNNPIDLHRFETMVFLGEQFFQLGISIISHPDIFVFGHRGEVTLLFGVPEGSLDDLRFSYVLYQFEGLGKGSQTERHVTTRKRPPDLLEVQVTSTYSSFFRFELMGRNTKIKDDEDDMICTYLMKLDYNLGESELKFTEQWMGQRDHKDNVLMGLDDLDLSAVTAGLKERDAVLAQQAVERGEDPTDDKMTVGLFGASEGVFGVTAALIPAEEVAVLEQPGDEQRIKELEHEMEQAMAQNNLESMDRIVKDLHKFLKARGGPNVLSLAKRNRDILKTKLGLEEAIFTRDIQRISQALSVVREKRYYKLQKAYGEACGIRDKLARIQEYANKVLDLDEKSLSEIRSYRTPPPAINQVMKGALLLMGNSIQDVEDWPKVQHLLSQVGEGSIRRRLAELYLLDITLDMARKANTCIMDLDLKAISEVNAAVATFFIWVKAVIDEVETRDEGVGKGAGVKAIRKKRLPTAGGKK